MSIILQSILLCKSEKLIKCYRAWHLSLGAKAISEHAISFEIGSQENRVVSSLPRKTMFLHHVNPFMMPPTPGSV